MTLMAAVKNGRIDSRGILEQRRAFCERVLLLARALPRRERRIMDARYREGLSLAAAAERFGMSPTALDRRIRTLLARMQTPRFQFVAFHSEALPADVAATAKLVAVRGHSLRRTARLRGLSLHRVREQMGLVKALAEI